MERNDLAMRQGLRAAASTLKCPTKGVFYDTAEDSASLAAAIEAKEDLATLDLSGVCVPGQGRRCAAACAASNRDPLRQTAPHRLTDCRTQVAALTWTLSAASQMPWRRRRA